MKVKEPCQISTYHCLVYNFNGVKQKKETVSTALDCFFLEEKDCFQVMLAFFVLGMNCSHCDILDDVTT